MDEIFNYILNRAEQNMQEEREKENIPRMSLGTTLCDRNIGGAKGVDGVTFSSILQLQGMKGCGKSFICTEIIGAGLRLFGRKLKYNYDDPEDGNSIDTMTRYGYPLKPEGTLTSRTVEEVYVNIRKFGDLLEDDEYGIYVLDSLDAVTSEETVKRGDERYNYAKKDKKFDKGTFALNKPKYLSGEFFPLIKPYIQKKKILLILLSQMRGNVAAMVGPKTTASGGFAVEHWMDNIISLSKIEKITKTYKGTTLPKGGRIKFETKLKARSARPYRYNYFVFDDDYGIDDVQSNAEYYFDLLTDTGKGKKTCKVTWDEQEFKTVENLVKYIYDNEQEDVLAKLAIEKWEDIEEHCKSFERKRRRVTLFDDIQEENV